MEFILSAIRTGQRAVVTSISDACPLKSRLREFGLVPGTMLQCRFKSPGGDLAALEVRGAVIALRVRDLSDITARSC